MCLCCFLFFSPCHHHWVLISTIHLCCHALVWGRPKPTSKPCIFPILFLTAKLMKSSHMHSCERLWMLTFELQYPLTRSTHHLFLTSTALQAAITAMISQPPQLQAEITTMISQPLQSLNSELQPLVWFSHSHSIAPHTSDDNDALNVLQHHSLGVDQLIVLLPLSFLHWVLS